MGKLSLLDINKQVIEIVKSIKILDKISWPVSVEEAFFKAISKGKKSKLSFEYPKSDYFEQEMVLESFLPKLSLENPLHIYTSLTIKSYINSLKMIHSLGTKKFEELSIQEYGRPTHLLFGSKYSHLETAKNFLKSFHDYEHPYLSDNLETFSGKKLKKYLLEESKKILGDDTPNFKLTSKMSSKAAAGKRNVRIRESAKFNRYDFKQLLIHEVMTHTLTAINGSHQTKLPLLSMGAPRTTKTQEGLATFSEVITGSLDLVRLKRISLRVIALEMALNGADIYELFHFFKENGQDDKESYLSASRLLRGGYPEGGIVFTKDGVYLEGLIRVHSFFRWAFKTKNLDLIHLLFCGRMDINDIFLLQPCYEQGLIKAPSYLPEWYQDIDLLAGKMAFSLILNGIDLNLVEAHFLNKFERKVA